MSDALTLSVVVPMYNEQQVVSLFFNRLRPVLDQLAGQYAVSYEVVCVDDGSEDLTAEFVMTAREAWPQIRLVRLVRNAGHQSALTAGFEVARGDHVVTIDADLQDPPETIVDMYALARRCNLDVVYAVRSDRRKDTLFKRVTSDLYYRAMRRIAGDQVPHNAGDFRLVSRRVVNAISRLPEHGRVHRLVIPWFGFPSEEVRFSREKRAAGHSKYPLTKMVALAFNSLVSFSAAPLRVATYAGALGIVFGAFALAWSIYGWLGGHTVPGWTSILATTGTIGAIQLVCLGLLGEYVARIFTVIQRRPTFLIGYDSTHDDGHDYASHPERAAFS